MLAAAACASGCAPALHGFARIDGGRLPVPLYQGAPPVIYTHARLGKISTEVGYAGTPGEQRYRAMYNLARQAIGKGANAVIHVTSRSTEKGLRLSGEAVSFDIHPPEPEEPDVHSLPDGRDRRRGD